MAWNRWEIVRAAFAADGPGVAFDPIRAQRLLFLMDREVSARIGGPYFDFRPCDFGPFDGAVYPVLDDLVRTGDLRVDASGRSTRYLLTDMGYRRGAVVLGELPRPLAEYLRDAARWVRLTPYGPMLAGIHRRYPDTAVNSVVGGRSSELRRETAGPFVRGMARAFDFTGTAQRAARSGKAVRTDAEAIHDAWQAVGEELAEAMTRFGESERLW